MNQFAMQMIMLVIFLFLMYLLLIRPQKKREKKIEDMRSNIKVGDEVVTIGGICGKIVKTKENTLVIQVGTDKTKFEITRWAVSSVVSTKTERVEEKEKEKDAEKRKAAKPKRIDAVEEDKVEEPAEASVDTQETVEEPIETEAVENAETAEEE